MRDAAQKRMKQRGAPASRLQFIMLVPSIPDHRDVCAEKLLPEHRRSTFDGGIPAFLSGCADHFQIDTVDSRTTEKRGGDTACLNAAASVTAIISARYSRMSSLSGTFGEAWTHGKLFGRQRVIRPDDQTGKRYPQGNGKKVGFQWNSLNKRPRTALGRCEATTKERVVYEGHIREYGFLM